VSTLVLLMLLEKGRDGLAFFVCIALLSLLLMEKTKWIRNVYTSPLLFFRCFLPTLS
jgi:hypothetical protein